MRGEKSVASALHTTTPARSLGILLAVAALLFSARMADLSLDSLEDAFYAREAVEMERAGRAYTVTWNGIPTHQHPPLEIWILSRSFALFGEGDFAARLPVLVMGLGTLAATYRLGALTLGPPAAVTSVALLLTTPYFVANARRCMMEVPLAFWITLTMLCYVEGRRRPVWHLVLGLPLGAAILTKSVLGLMPVLAIGAAMAAVPELRADLRRSWLWLGLALGLALGVSWPVHQGLTQGIQAVRSHYLTHVIGRSTHRFDVVAAAIAYPWILLKFYQPVVLPGLVGAWRRWRRWPPGGHDAAVLVAWTLVPVLLYSVSSFRTPRFVFPILPALALCAGAWLAETLPRLAAVLVRWLVPLGAVMAAVVLWVAPPAFERDPNAVLKHGVDVVKAALPAGDSLPYLGHHYWLVASPLLYYAERLLERAGDTPDEAVAVARRHPSRLLLVGRNRLAEVGGQGVRWETLLEDRDWVLLRLSSSAVPQPR